MNGFLNWWQHLPEHMDPVIFQIGSFRLQYYGLMYIVAFAFTYGLAAYRLKHEDRFSIDIEQLQGLITALILGLIIGARIGYVIFYNFSYYLQHPLEIILPFQFSGGFHFTGISGMSYHGGLIGVVIAALIFVRKNKLSFLDMADLIVPCIPLGYTFGRLGNFINGELYGRVTTHAIGMFFPLRPGLDDATPRSSMRPFSRASSFLSSCGASRGASKPVAPCWPSTSWATGSHAFSSNMPGNPTPSWDSCSSPFPWARCCAWPWCWLAGGCWSF